MFSGLRLIAAAVLVLVVGAYGLSASFSDLRPEETFLGRFVVTGGVILLAGVAIGALQRHRWWISIALASGPMLIGALMLAARLRGGVRSASPRFALAYLVGLPALALLGGFVGSRLVAKWRRKPPPTAASVHRGEADGS